MLAGVAGALAMSVAMWIAREFGLNVNLEAMLGSLFEAPSSPQAFLIGFGVHLAIGAGIGLLYAAAFEYGMQRAGVIAGAGLGLCHGLMAGLMMSSIPAMNPLAHNSAAPGAFLSNVPYGPILFMVLHILFGAVVGVAYGTTVEKPHVYPGRTVTR